jgi:hypothetical protein
MKIEAKRTPVPRTKNMNEPRSPHLYKIETADVPGMALRIAERIVRYHGAIESYFLDTSASELVDKVGYGKGLAAHFVAITPVDESGRVTDGAWAEAKMVQFEMDLQQGLGIQRFQRIPTSAEFMAGLDRANGKRRAGDAG